MRRGWNSPIRVWPAAGRRGTVTARRNLGSHVSILFRVTGFGGPRRDRHGAMPRCRESDSEVRTSIQLQVRDVAMWSRHRTGRPRRVFDAWSLRVGQGEVVAVAGASGFGGTTLARVVAGLARPFSGTVLINGVDVTDKPSAERRVGLMPAGGGLLPQLTLEHNITYGVRLSGQPRAVISRRLDALAERLGLLPSLRLLPHEISPGQRFRAAFARAAMKSPDVMVVDATAGAEGLVSVRNLMELAALAPAPPVLLCSDRPEVVSQADWVVVRLGSRAGSNGEIGRLRAGPPDLVTARLVLPGPVIEFEGTVRGGEVEFAGMRVPISGNLRSGRRVVVLTSDGLALGPPDDGVSQGVGGADRCGGWIRSGPRHYGWSNRLALPSRDSGSRAGR